MRPRARSPSATPRSIRRCTARVSRRRAPRPSLARSAIPTSPIDDLLAFHIVFGKTVPDVSLNAVANLGYADCRFLKAVYPGDTLSSVSDVIGLKENSNRQTGVVYVRSRGLQPARRDGGRIRALGDGEKARSRRRRRPRRMSPICPRRSRRRTSARPARPSTAPPSTSR